MFHGTSSSHVKSVTSKLSNSGNSSESLQLSNSEDSSGYLEIKIFRKS